MEIKLGSQNKATNLRKEKKQKPADVFNCNSAMKH